MANPAARMTMMDDEISTVKPQKYIKPSRSINVKAMQVKTQKTVTKSEMRINVTLTTAAMVNPKFRISSSLITFKLSCTTITKIKKNRTLNESSISQNPFHHNHYLYPIGFPFDVGVSKDDRTGRVTFDAEINFVRQ